MLSAGHIFLPARCVRCQIPQALSHCRLRPSAIRSSLKIVRRVRLISTSSCVKREEAATTSEKEEKDSLSAHFRNDGHPHIKTARSGPDSLNKLSGTPVLHDTEKEFARGASADAIGRLHAHNGLEQERGGERTGEDGNAVIREKLSVQDIENAIGDEHLLPTEDEVNTSIDKLRPKDAILDQHNFEALVTQLTAGYSSHQLSRYFFHSFARTDAGQSQLHQPKISLWRPGRSPLEQRHKSIVGKRGSNSKKHKAEKIIRFVWQVVVSSEEQKVGELEVSLESWQISMLFDLVRDSKPNYQRFLSPLLVQRCEVRPYRPGNVMRIVASRQDAEEIARQLARSLLEVDRLEMDLVVFKPLLGTAGWPRKLAEIFRPGDIAHVSQLTGCVIEFADNEILTIYSVQSRARETARRLLLSLLELPESVVTDKFIAKFAPPDAADPRTRAVESSTIHVAANTASLDLPRQYRGLNLFREIAPISRSRRKDKTTGELGRALVDDPPPASPRSLTPNAAHPDLARAFQLRMGGFYASQTTKSRRSPPTSYWRSRLDSSETVKFCHVLAAEHDRSDQGTDDALSSGVQGLAKESGHIMQHHAPGAPTVLSHLRPRRGHQPGPRLVARFMPSPFTSRGLAALTKLPRIELSFRTVSGDVLLSGARMVIHQHHLNVLLPDQATDLQFSRTISLSARKTNMIEDDNIRLFTESLSQSIRSNATTAISGNAEVEFKLPRWLLQADAQGEPTLDKDNMPVAYLCEKVEYTETTKFRCSTPILSTRPLDENSPEWFEWKADDITVEYTEIDGGSIGGNRTVLSLRVKPSELPAEAGSVSHAAHDKGTPSALEYESPSGTESSGFGQKVSTYDLANAALRFAELLTRANAGELD